MHVNHHCTIWDRFLKMSNLNHLSLLFNITCMCMRPSVSLLISASISYCWISIITGFLKYYRDIIYSSSGFNNCYCYLEFTTTQLCRSPQELRGNVERYETGRTKFMLQPNSIPFKLEASTPFQLTNQVGSITISCDPQQFVENILNVRLRGHATYFSLLCTFWKVRLPSFTQELGI